MVENEPGPSDGSRCSHSELSAWRLHPKYIRRESASEGHDKHASDYYRDQVNRPGSVAFTYKVDVSRAIFVSIYVKMHGNDLRPSSPRAAYHFGGPRARRIRAAVIMPALTRAPGDDRKRRNPHSRVAWPA